MELIEISKRAGSAMALNIGRSMVQVLCVIAVIMTLACHEGNVSTLTLSNLSDQKVSLNSSLLKDVIELMPHSDRVLEVERFKEVGGFWYESEVNGKVEELHGGRAFGDQGKIMWVRDAVVRIEKDGDLVFVMLKVE